MNNSEPNVVPGEAAATARTLVFERRGAEVIDPSEITARLLAAGYGSDIPSEIRKKRVRTWVMQVLRRLRKHGWLDAPGESGWPVTPALEACEEPRALRKQARVRPAPRPASQPSAPQQSAPQSVAPQPSPPARRALQSSHTRPESWGAFVQDWVFSHRWANFGIAELAVAMVQGGYGAGEIGGRLDGARAIAEQELAALEEEALLDYDADLDLWQPSELLQSWPEA
jgi:hypothetical protein